MTTCIGDPSAVGEARRNALGLAGAAGWTQTDAGKLAIAVTEAASNILKHAKNGEILLRANQDGIEMLAIDRGPGIANVAEALQDGKSSAGTAGIGLGAIARIASRFDIYTGPGLGTALSAQFQAGHVAEPEAQQIGAAQAPYPGEVECGDAWAVDGTSLFLADGLGHGLLAAQAAAAAVTSFQENSRRPARDAVEAVHRALRSTRGAAVGLAQIDRDRHLLCFCGVGNISGVIVTGQGTRSLMSHNGTAGHEVHRIAQLEYAWPEDALLVLHTDGISAKWDLDAYPGLRSRHPSLIAAVLYRDFRRQRDDATVVVARERTA